jgi:hypothetical protein
MSNREALVSGPTTEEKKAIVAHAKEIYTRLCLAEPVTSKNAKGHRAKAEQAIEQAELFHDAIKERGYENG